MAIIITEEMKQQALEEAKKRNPYINHHFNVNHLTDEDRDIIGFLGEFAGCTYLGVDWRKNIRKDYLTIDSGDIKYKNLVIDIKTETIPNDPPYKTFDKVFNRKINDDVPYGRRLIVEGQADLLKKYDIVVFGAFIRGNYSKWYALGYLETDYILNNYEVTKETPFGSKYPEAALAIRTSELKPMNDLL